MESRNGKVLTAMGVVMLVCLVAMGIFAFPVGLPICGVIGLVYGLKYKERKFVLWSSVALAIGALWAAYALLVIYGMH